ncbi:MAG: DUF2778 domain-containing protein, partial [Nitrospirae bacterium]|nr:DUF2778 domain-containing protein [Nitrospirota bacterium]
NRTITYDNHGRIGTIVTGNIQSLAYAYDANSNITGITNNVESTKTKTYAYDALDRLTGAIGPWGTLNYTYDGVGNRKIETTATGVTDYTYAANKLMASTGEKTLSFGYDSNGNTIAENSRQYTYNQNQRLIKAAEGAGALGEYVYNANGQRVKKVANGVTTVFHFDNSGRLIAESGSNGNPLVQYVYLNSQPIAKIDSAGISYIHTDHLGTPVMMTNAGGQKVWEIEAKPFGDNANIMGSSTLNIRFPGQYYDEETGLHYNYFRDYSPQIGRYVEADPIGLAGGINLFSYVGNNSSNLIDSVGLAYCTYYISAHTLQCISNDYEFNKSIVTLGPDGVFSGVGECKNNSSERCIKSKDIGPIPTGRYKMNSDDRAKHGLFWRLEADPKVSGWQYYLGARGGFLLHPGSASLGCITVRKRDAKAMLQYRAINDLLKSEIESNYLKVAP